MNLYIYLKLINKYSPKKLAFERLRKQFSDRKSVVVAPFCMTLDLLGANLYKQRVFYDFAGLAQW